MAFIYKRKDKYAVGYRERTLDGRLHQRWETYDTLEEAEQRKVAVEKLVKAKRNPAAYMTMNMLLDEVIANYGKGAWTFSSYQNNVNCLNNYVRPYLGELKIGEITTHDLDMFYARLQQTSSVQTYRNKTVSSRTIEEINKLLKMAFNKAIKWEYLVRNPAKYAAFPKTEYKERDIWTPGELKYALDTIKDPLMELFIQLAFAGSMRVGEICGLTWDCVHISAEKIALNNAKIVINKVLQRVSRESLENVQRKNVIEVFPSYKANPSTCLVLKPPKTSSSNRTVWLPEALAKALLEWKAKGGQNNILSEPLHESKLVFTRADGRPVDPQFIGKRFQDVLSKAGLRKVHFHSIRHTSITYKLKLTNGDLKAVQGDSGHSQLKMVTDVYSHVLDEDRKHIAIQVQKDFFEDGAGTNGDSTKIIQWLKQNPKMLDVLALLAENP